MDTKAVTPTFKKDVDTWIEVGGVRGELLKAVQGHALLKVASTEPILQEDYAGSVEAVYVVPPEYLPGAVLLAIARAQHQEYGIDMSVLMRDIEQHGAYVRAAGCVLK